MQLCGGQHRQQRKYCAHGAQELAEEPGLHRHTDENEHEQPDAQPEAFRRGAQGSEPGKDLPRAPAGEPAVDPGRAQADDGGKHQIFYQLAQTHGLCGQGELLFAVKELFLYKAGQPINGIAEAAEGADIPAEEPAEQDREPAQADERKCKAVQLQYLPGADAQEQLLHAGKAGHEGAGHGEKEEQLDAGPQQNPVLQGLLLFLRRSQRLFFCLCHFSAAFPSASATASRRPSQVRVAPDTISTSADCAESISSSMASD